MNAGPFSMSSLSSAAAVLLLVACSGGDSGSHSKVDPSNNGGQGASGGTNSGATNPVCTRWKTDRAKLQEGAWTGGDTARCIAGDLSIPGRENTLTQINLFRYLAKLPPVASDLSLDAKAQQCALMISINGLNHAPPSSWTCYSADGAQAAANSNEATTPAVSAVDLYLRDTGHSTTLGHRRWLLSSGLGPVGIGSTDVASCLWVMGGTGSGSNAGWTAFPAAGPIPAEAAAMVDGTGWSIQSDAISFDRASVRITENGIDKPVQVATLLPGYGSSYAMSMIPVGWSSQAGRTYHVSIAASGQSIDYDVEVVDCP